MQDQLSPFWAQDLEPGDTQGERNRLAELVAAAPALRALRARLESDIRAAEAIRVAGPRYEDSCWPFRQADLNGQLRTLYHLVDKLDFV
jgi:hypothetical protein